MGDPLKTYGEMRQAWERRRRMGGRQAVWGAKIALKPGIWERWRPADFAYFREFWREAAARHGGRQAYGDQQNMAMYEPHDTTCGFCGFIGDVK